MGAPSLLKSLLPPVLLGPVRRLAGTGLRLTGPYPDWAAARAASAGYDAPLILDRVRAATREVVAGRAAFERDSVLFAQPAHRYPLLAALLRAAARSQGRLHVIDFGGALGSLYWQYRAALAGLNELRWTVVEQSAFVDAGEREFAGGPLQFSASVEDAAQTLHSPLVLASSVLQYVQDPLAMLDRFASIRASALLIDRTPVSDGAGDRVCVQHVPRRIYPASYPTWVFSRPALLRNLERGWSVQWLLPCDEGRHRSSGGLRFTYEGYLLERKP